MIVIMDGLAVRVAFTMETLGSNFVGNTLIES